MIYSVAGIDKSAQKKRKGFLERDDVRTGTSTVNLINGDRSVVDSGNNIET